MLFHVSAVLGVKAGDSLPVPKFRYPICPPVSTARTSSDTHPFSFTADLTFLGVPLARQIKDVSDLIQRSVSSLIHTVDLIKVTSEPPQAGPLSEPLSPA